MMPVAAMVLSLVMLGGVRAEIVYSNLNTNPSANLTYGFTQFAQRFTTGSAGPGTGLHLDLNIISLSGSQSYAVELWSASVTGSNVNALLAPIGGGTLSATDMTELTSFDLTYGLAASTNYFVRLTCTADVGWVLGPSSSASLNSVFRYGMSSLSGSDPSIAGGMKVDVVGVPEPSTYAMVGLACGGYSLIATLGRLRLRRHTKV